MTLLEAIKARHSVRKYKDKPLEEEHVRLLKEKINTVNSQSGLHIQLVMNEPKAFKSLLAYGKFSGVTSYLVMAGPKGDDLDETIGYYGEQLVLFAQTLGINSCWAAVSFKKIPGTYSLEESEKIVCYIALGYGEDDGITHKIKSVEEVSNASDLTPKWFRPGIEAALLAPTAVNQQKFRIDYIGPKGDGIQWVKVRTLTSVIGYTRIDLGIVKYNFETAVGKDIFKWC